MPKPADRVEAGKITPAVITRQLVTRRQRNRSDDHQVSPASSERFFIETKCCLRAHSANLRRQERVADLQERRLQAIFGIHCR